MAELKHKILETATELYMLKGFHQTSLNDIARAAKINKSSIFYHFDNKFDLFEQVLQYRASMQSKRLERIVTNANLTLKEKWDLFLDNEYDMLATRQIGCFFAKIGLELNGTHQDSKKELKTFFDIWYHLIKQLFKNKFDLQTADEMAKNVIIRIEGATILSIAYGDFTILKKEIEQLKQLIT